MPVVLDFAINQVIEQVMLFFKWRPTDLKELYADRQDVWGLYYWYDLYLELRPKK